MKTEFYISGPYYWTFLLSAAFIISFIICLGCNDNNPAAPDPDEYVTVYLVLTENGRATKIYCNDQIVSYLQYQGERDTIKVPDRIQLKARIYKNGDFEYKIITAEDQFLWELP